MNQQHTSSTTLAVAGVSKTLGGVKLFTDVSLQLQQGQSLAVIGESGSGKSTLLHLMAGLDRPDTGEVYWAGTAIHTLNTNQIAARRLRHVGLVFQAYYLMPHLNAQQNVELPFLLAGEKPNHSRCIQLLDQVGISHETIYRHAYADKAATKDPQPEINLRADKSVRYDSVAQVLAASRRAGLTKLGFVTEPD